MLWHLFSWQTEWSLRTTHQIPSLFGLKILTHTFLPLVICDTFLQSPLFFPPQNKLKRLTGWKKTNKHKSKNPSQHYPIALRLKFKLDSRAYSFFLLISIFFFSGTILQFHYLLFISEHAKPFPTSGNLHLLHIFIEILFLQLYTVLVPSFKYQFR